MSDTPEPSNIPFAQPPEPPAGLSPDNSEKQFALFVHLSALLGFFIPLGNIIAPLVMWQIKKNESAFIDDQGKEAVNFNLTLLLVGLALVLLTLITFGLGALLTVPLGLALCVAWLIFAILAGIKANEGIAYRYPYILRLIK
ncbi:DUF4870 domain-containing protein [uncultured Aquimonas sp.]|jgi:uncharacterized protein|uniref:DUF4870 domain-containing protein n=1 Tax=uncultured Aquimonas sp. TaxID=385483 RepID=UPI000869EFBC|nr:DUF4870 domain-containing protein [uncultured Aquimonas sp.]ODU48144.1 MAG: orotate phosphoribosyltransferase [Xanthomonadaceae bacterium SCN 69-123]